MAFAMISWAVCVNRSLTGMVTKTLTGKLCMWAIKNFSQRGKEEKDLEARIGPSVLNSDLSSLSKETIKLVQMGADYIHLDVMDGHFVPNLTFGPPVIKALRRKVKNVFFEAHMMVCNPAMWIEPMSAAGVDLYTFHIEAVDRDELEPLCVEIRENNMKVGIALKPNTPVKDVVNYVDLADVVLVMTVEPGFGGQKFMFNMIPKIQCLRKNFQKLDIEVDGGVDHTAIEQCAKAGANMIVAGTAITKSKDPARVISELRKAVNNHLHPELNDPPKKKKEEPKEEKPCSKVPHTGKE